MNIHPVYKMVLLRSARDHLNAASWNRCGMSGKIADVNVAIGIDLIYRDINMIQERLSDLIQREDAKGIESEATRT